MPDTLFQAVVSGQKELLDSIASLGFVHRKPDFPR